MLVSRSQTAPFTDTWLIAVPSGYCVRSQGHTLKRLAPTLEASDDTLDDNPTRIQPRSEMASYLGPTGFSRSPSFQLDFESFANRITKAVIVSSELLAPDTSMQMLFS